MEADRLFDSFPNRTRPSAGSSGDGDSSGRNHSPHHGKSLENPPPPVALIPPRVLPLLHDLAEQMVKAGHQQQCFKIYR